MSSKSKYSDAAVLRCPSCGANIVYSPITGRWTCSSCGGTFTEDDFKNVADENVAAEKNAAEVEPTVTESAQPELDVFRCQSCGAELVTDSNTVATFCAYCGSADIIKDRLEGEYRPDYVLPFTISKDEALNCYTKHCKEASFVPGHFFDLKNIKIQGTYVPFCLYSGRSEGTLKGQFEQTSSTNRDMIDIYSYVRSGKMDFARIPADVSIKMDNALMDSIELFDFNQLKEFNYAYLSGFLAEKYDVERDESEQLKRVSGRMESSLQNRLSKGSVSSSDLKSNFSAIEYVLMPVWMLCTEFEGKEYIFAVNGQSGKTEGFLPCDAAKKWLWFFILTISISAVISLPLYFFIVWLYNNA